MKVMNEITGPAVPFQAVILTVKPNKYETKATFMGLPTSYSNAVA